MTYPAPPGRVTGNLSRRGGRPAGRRYELSALLGVLLLVINAPASVAAPDPGKVQQELNRTAAEYHRVEAELAVTEDRIDQLEEDLAEADGIIRLKVEAFQDRAGFLYKSRGLSLLQELLTSPNGSVFLRRFQMLEKIGERDVRLVDEIQILKSRAAAIREKLEAERARQRGLVAQLRNKTRQLGIQLQAAKSAARVAKYGDFDAFTLPLLGPVAFSNSWGDPRSGGRRHQGTDLFAPCGASAVAVTNGAIQDMHSGSAGGIMLWLRASNGDVFFYAHLRGYAAGIYEGKRVQVGELVAYNGNSGNARGGACHLHFEWHPGGGRAVNPYFLLRAALG